MITEPRAVLPLVLAGLGSGLLLALRRVVRGTTLTGPWLWTWFGVWGVALAEVGLASQSPSAASRIADPIRYLAATASVCPLIAWLGAKRPQHRAWHFIVASLWGVLILPAIESLVLGRGRALEIADLRAWFLLVLVIVGWVNFLPTRYWPAAVLWGAAQIALAGPLLPLIQQILGTTYPRVGLGLEVAALATLAIPRRRATPGCRLDSAWRAFRDCYGLLWGLRVAERFTALARQQQWPVDLHWSGFRVMSASGALPPETELAVARCLRSLLGRFVSPGWLDAHCVAGSALGCETPADSEP